MLFKRRQPRGLFPYLREWVWPTMGWNRTLSYFHHRLFRSADSSYRITGGLATGVAVSFTPLLGTHFLQALLYAHFFRQSKIAAMIGTFWGNPWTIPPMFYFDYKLGNFLLTLGQGRDDLMLPSGQGLGYLLSEPSALFLPLMLGGVVFALLVWPLAYMLLYFPVRGMRRAYRLRRLLLVRFKKRQSQS
ncbi:MAG: DUF2062 domain-containing protein [Alphaproteobacteria bacterium]|nr:DUF2062 domain-containing protein [Alphaproteobacteria bacterium]